MTFHHQYHAIFNPGLYGEAASGPTLYTGNMFIGAVSPTGNMFIGAVAAYTDS